MTELEMVGHLLCILTEFSDIELQAVLQAGQPQTFVPSALLEDWYRTFRIRRMDNRSDVSEALISALADFTFHLDSVADAVPDDPGDKVGFIRSNVTWHTVKEMADLTLDRITQTLLPTLPGFSHN